MARRSDHNKDELRNLILKSAKAIVVKEGFSNLSARKIAKKIGYTVGTLYNFFKDLNELILYINAETLDSLYEMLLVETCKCKNTEERLYKIASTYIEFSTKNYYLWNMLLEHHYPRPLGEKLPKWYQIKIEKNFTLVEETLNEIIKNKAESERYSKVLWSGLHGICNLSLTGKLNTTEAESAQILTKSFIKVFIKGIK